MKLYIEILDGEHPTKQLEAVSKFIEVNGFKETGKDIGRKINHSKGVNHVSLNKTKGNNYSIKVWRGL